MLIDFFKLSLSNLKRRKLRSWLTVLGILIGITAVVSLMSLGNGLKAAVNAQFGISSTEVISVQAGGLSGYGAPGTGVIKKLTKDDAEAISKLSTVKRAIGRNIRSASVEFNDKVFFGYLTNVPDGEDREFVYSQLDTEAERGRLLKDGDNNKVFLGYNFYVDKVGFEKIIDVGNKIIINGEGFEVVGISKKTGSFIFENVIYMNSEQMQDLLDYGDEVDIIAVQVKDKSLINRAKEQIETEMRKRRGVKEGEEDFEVSTPESSLATVNSVIGGVQIFIVIIALISIFVGALGIVNTMTTSVLERKKEIGTMKAIGAKNSQIFTIFLIESGLLGLIGGIIGSIIGMLAGYAGTKALSDFIGADLKPTIDFMLISLALVGSFFVGAVSGIAPALKAAGENPVDALRS
ncbi:MAG: ABC transporter permease [Candidatus Nanoarchaeia archaeon]